MILAFLPECKPCGREPGPNRLKDYCLKHRLGFVDIQARIDSERARPTGERSIRDPSSSCLPRSSTATARCFCSHIKPSPHRSNRALVQDKIFERSQHS